MIGIPYEIEDDSYYLFTCAELKAKEKQFVSQGRIERMISAPGMEEFLNILGETVYAPELGRVEQDKSFEQVIISAYRDIVSFLDDRLREEHKKIVYILFFEEFLHNMKLILKSALSGEKLEELYIPLKYDYEE